MTRLRRLPGCICYLNRSFNTSSSQGSPAAADPTQLSVTQPHDPFNAFVSVAANGQASTSASPTGALSNLRISIKDNFVTQEVTSNETSTTTCGSRMLRNYRSSFEATVVKKLRQHGAEIVGKTNLDEFGMGSNGVFSVHGAVKNPLDPNRVAGGSSSGAAASVAAGYCDVAIGSDTGGSVRLPASYTGILGFKPSYGLLSRYGLVAYASSLDTVGIIAKQARHARRVFRTLNEHDSNDPTSIRPEYRQTSDRHHVLKKLRIGVPVECFPSELSRSSFAPLRRAISQLRSQVQVEIVSVSIPSTTKALSAYYTIASAEASSNLARYDGIRYGFRSEGETVEQTRTEGFGDEVKKRIILGTYALTADAFDNYFLAAQSLRDQLKSEMDGVFAQLHPLRGNNMELCNDQERPRADGVDILLFPSAISPAPTFEEAQEASKGVNTYVQDVLTVPASLSGLPAASCPISMSDAHEKMPVGVQVVGQWGDDELVLEVAGMLEG